MIIPWEPFLSLLIESVVCGDGNTQHQYLLPSLIDLHAYIILGTARPCPSYCECNLLFRFLQCQPWLLPFPADTRTPAGLSIRPLLTKGTRPGLWGCPGTRRLSLLRSASPPLLPIRARQLTYKITPHINLSTIKCVCHVPLKTLLNM